MSNQDDQEIVLAVTNPPSLFNFYPSVEVAEADKARANREDMEYEVMSYGDYRAAKRAFYLQPEVEVSAETFLEMLEVLPPRVWGCPSATFEYFIVGEAFDGVYSHMYVRRGVRYFERMVDVRDKSTWAKEVEA